MQHSHPCDRIDLHAAPLVMGVLNVTPDSFSDGGKYADPKTAVARARAMIAEGADIVDVGAESTRPGSTPVPAEEQIARAVPVIEAIRARDDRVAISIDTCLAPVASAALAAGANIVNDISAMRHDPAMVELVASSGCVVVLMHMRGTPTDMQAGGGPVYDDVIEEIGAFLTERRDVAVVRGVDRSRIVFDPGIGFGKRVEHNLTILRHLGRFVSLGQPLLIGASRKSFIGHTLGAEDPANRLAGSLACAAMAVTAGAAIIRCHDVKETVDVVRMYGAVGQAEGADPVLNARSDTGR